MNGIAYLIIIGKTKLKNVENKNISVYKNDINHPQLSTRPGSPKTQSPASLPSAFFTLLVVFPPSLPPRSTLCLASISPSSILPACSPPYFPFAPSTKQLHCDLWPGWMKSVAGFTYA